MTESADIIESNAPVCIPHPAHRMAKSPGAIFRRARPLLLVALVLVLLSPSAYLCWQARDGSQLGFFQDDGLYLTAAKSLVENGTYKQPSLPGQPYQTKYPPLYPLLLAAVWKFDSAFPANLKWFVLLNWCLWAAFLAVSFLAFRRLKLSWAARWGGFVLLACNPALLFLTIHFMSEALFSIFVIGAILFAEQASRTNRRPIAIAVCAAGAAACAFLTKTSALPLAATVPAMFLIRRQYARACAFTCVLTPIVIAWTVWTATHRLHSSDPVLMYYTDYFGFYKFNVQWQDIPTLIHRNLPFLLQAIAGAGPKLPKSLALGSVISLALCTLGTARLLTKARYLHAAAFMLVYALQLVTWHFSPNLRFLYPVLPFLVAGFVYELLHLTGLIKKSLTGRWATLRYVLPGVVLCAALLSVFPIPRSQTIRQILDQIADFRRSTIQRRAAYAWINEHLPTDVKFAAYDDVSLYLYTGRQGIRNEVLTRPYREGDVAGMHRPIAEIADFARKRGLAYLLWSQDDYAIDGVLNDMSLREQLLKHNNGLLRLYTAPGVRIYAVKPSHNAPLENTRMETHYK